MGLSEKEIQRKNRIFEEIRKIVSPYSITELSSMCGDIYSAEFTSVCDCMDELYNHRHNEAQDHKEVYYTVILTSGYSHIDSIREICRVAIGRLEGRRGKFIDRGSYAKGTNSTFIEAHVLIYQDFSVTFMPSKDQMKGMKVNAFTSIFNTKEAMDELSKSQIQGANSMSKYLDIMKYLGGGIV